MNKPFKIVNSFLFGETYEKELLLLKFQLERFCVDEWIVLENEYSFQGEYKGLWVNQIMDEDDRFAEFKDKITVMSTHFKFACDKTNVSTADNTAFLNEYKQRDVALNYFLDNYTDADWIIVSDVDEMIDSTSEVRRNALLERMMENQSLLHISVKRFWFDFDNEYAPVYGIPVCNKKYLVSEDKSLSDVRRKYHGKLQMNWDLIIGFEYSSCFNKEDILRKLDTNSHTGFTRADLERALACNHRPFKLALGEQPDLNKKNLFETVRLTESNSPALVRENLKTYKTNNINKAYKQKRKELYPELFSAKGYLRHYYNSVSNYCNKRIIYLKRFLGRTY